MPTRLFAPVVALVSLIPLGAHADTAGSSDIGEPAAPRLPDLGSSAVKPTSEAVNVDIPRANVFAGGFDTYLGTTEGPAIVFSAAHVFGTGDVGLLVGGRVGAYFGGNPGRGTVFRTTIDLGFRNYFSRGHVSVGMIAVGQPGAYETYDWAYVSIGGSVGPIVEVGRLHLQLPMGGAVLFPTTNSLGRSGVAHAGLLAGVTF